MSTATSAPSRLWSALISRGLEPIDSASLRLWRVAFGALIVISVIRFFVHGWIEAFYVEPELTFPYPGFSFLKPWAEPGMSIHFAVLGLLGLLIALGVFFRLACALFFVGFAYVELLDQTHYLNHYYLIALLSLLCAFMPLGRSRRTAPRWCLWVLRGQVGLVYVFAGIAKLNADWLFEAQPLTIWLATKTDLPLLGPLLAEEGVAFFASWAGAFFDLTVVFLLLARRTRTVAFAVVVVFHAATAALFPIGLFPWIMVVNATLFLEPNWPRRLLGKSPEPTSDLPKRLVKTRQRIGAAAIATYFAIQLVVPMRAALYPGNGNWTEEGMRFSWRVMLNEKVGLARFVVREPSTGREWIVYPREYLTGRQEKMMSFQPEMVRQFASHLASDYRDRGILEPTVHATVFVAWNGRRSRPLIDSTVDLAGESFTWRASTWVVSRH